MNKEVKEKWVSALRSREYQQARGRLRRKDGYCCLGVLCDIYHKETGKGMWDSSLPDDFSFIDDGHRDVSNLIPTVLDWAGISKRNPDIKANNLSDESKQYLLQNKLMIVGVYSLASLNDQGINFEGIANIIEENNGF